MYYVTLARADAEMQNKRQKERRKTRKSYRLESGNKQANIGYCAHTLFLYVARPVLAILCDANLAILNDHTTAALYQPRSATAILD